LGKKVNVAKKFEATNVYFAGPNLNLDDNKVDARWENQVFSNHSFKLILLSGTALLPSNLMNPFSTPEGGKVSGYIDMVGARNEDDAVLTGYEGDTVPSPSNGAYQFISKQKAVRRKNLIDTDNNNADFEIIDYQPSKMLKTQKEFYRPKNTGHGPWNPVTVPQVSEDPSNVLLILQVYGDGGKDEAAVSHSFVELYNNTAEEIDLGDYSLQYSEGGTTWWKLDLSGHVPPGHSFLIRGKEARPGPAAMLSLGVADMEWDISLSSVQFKICLIKSKMLLTVSNPFTADGGNPAVGYQDMFGAFDNDRKSFADMGTIIDGYEGDLPPSLLSKQKAARRKSLTDHNENAYDFAAFDYRDKNKDSKGNTPEDIARFRPRTVSDGAYTPVF
jgi:hypothetical protein